MCTPALTMGLISFQEIQKMQENLAHMYELVSCDFDREICHNLVFYVVGGLTKQI